VEDGGLEVGIELTRAAAVPAGRLEELYVRHASDAMRLAYFLTGDRETARDLVHDAFVKIAGRLQHLRIPDAFDAYLRRTIVNLFTSHLRRLRLERRQAARAVAEPEQAHEDPDVTERDEMWRAVQSLPPRQRAAIVLRFYEDLSERQTAEVLRCSPGAANQLITRAVATLRDRIGQERIGDEDR
jgi:RNA polymerase sigma-70 factor (sigma-E family)